MIRNFALALTALALAAAAHAGTYAVTGSFDNDPGVEVLTGSFSFDDAQVAAGGFDGSFDLTSLNFTFLGQTYALTDATTAYVQFDFGSLSGPVATFSTSGGTLDLQSFFGTNYFTYVTRAGEAYGTLSLDVAASVPEPASYALVLAALGGGLFARRRKA
ncbi:PEP-CTERM sorting domain-containing protein [Roseateles sp. P5_E7]